jgi:hypothetical protein
MACERGEMGLLDKDPVKQQEKERAKAAKQEAAEQARREEIDKANAAAFAGSPQGRARSARQAGATMFQISLPVSATEKAFWGDQALTGSSMMTRTTQVQQGSDLELIEGEGWRLDHVGYVFQPTGTQSRDRLLSSGQVETIVGNVVGIYLFRAAS